MASERNLISNVKHNGEWLENHCKNFMKQLIEQGYSKHSIQVYELALRRLKNEIQTRNIGINDLDITTIEAIQELVVNKTAKTSKKHAKFCIRQFIDFLVSEHVISQLDTCIKEPTPFDLLKEEYSTYLCHQRALSKSTIGHCISYMERFIDFHFKGTETINWDTVTINNIIAFMSYLMNNPRPWKSTAMPSHLRNFFSFLFWSGKTLKNLADSIPKVSSRRNDNLPSYIKQEDVERLVEAVRNTKVNGLRNYAMFLLLARLGLRPKEVVSIQLEDINWRSGEILIRGKGKYHDFMPLTHDIGKGIVDYIKNERKGTSRTLFVSSIPPFKQFKSSLILNTILHKFYKNTTLKPPKKYVGSRLLRHSLAVNMLQKGISLDEISKVLRHRSRITTTIYAKHDINSLRTITQPWPVNGGNQ